MQGAAFFRRDRSMRTNVRMRESIGSRLTWSLAAWVVTACAKPSTSSPTPVPSTKSASGKADTVAIIPGIFSTVFGPGEEQYDVQSTSSVQLLGDSTSRTDSTYLKSKITVRFTVGQSSQYVTAVVRIDSATVRATNSIVAAHLPDRSILFNIDSRNGHVTPSVTEPVPSCTEGTLVLPLSGIEVLPTIPTSLSNAWADTSFTHTCRGSVLLTVTRIATYVPSEGSNQSTMQIVRTSQARVSGSGYQWSQKVDVSGEGIATDTLSFGLAGRLERISGTSSLRLAFRSPFRTQQFSQITTTTISSTQ